MSLPNAKAKPSRVNMREEISPTRLRAFMRAPEARDTGRPLQEVLDEAAAIIERQRAALSAIATYISDASTFDPTIEVIVRNGLGEE